MKALPPNTPWNIEEVTYEDSKPFWMVWRLCLAIWFPDADPEAPLCEHLGDYPTAAAAINAVAKTQDT